MSQHIVKVPTLEEIKKELGVTSMDELDKKTKRLQIKAGNNSSKLTGLDNWLVKPSANGSQASERSDTPHTESTSQ
jgi:hypothetical protein